MRAKEARRGDNEDLPATEQPRQAVPGAGDAGGPLPRRVGVCSQE